MASGLSPCIRLHGLNSMVESPRGWMSSALENNGSRTREAWAGTLGWSLT